MAALTRIQDYYDEKTLQWFDIMIEGILIMDESMVIQYANQAYVNYTRLRREDIVGHNIVKVRPGALTPKVYATKKPMFNAHRTPGGGSESYTDIIPILSDNAVVGALAVVRDVEVLKSLYARLQEKDTHISQLTQAIHQAYQVRYTFEDLCGSKGMTYRELAQRAASADSPVLIAGESGTGKEVLAQAIHASSSRKSGPFVDVNCAALPEALLESELFGYAPGAFTGASKNGKMGLFELANGGTIFLDEISEMRPSLQSKLLRVLQEKQVRRIGGEGNIPLDVRVIAATNQNIDQAVEEQRFRSDLFYRLAVVVIHIPPLRERRGDIGELIAQFLRPLEQKNGVKYRFSKDAMKLMEEYSWPGNIRQLQNAIEYVCMIAPDGPITANALPYYLLQEVPARRRKGRAPGRSRAKPNETLAETLERVEKEVISEMLCRYGATTDAKKDIACALNISLATLYNKLKRYGLNESRSSKLLE